MLKLSARKEWLAEMNMGNLTLVYGAVAVLSILLLVGYLLWEKKR